MGFLSRHDPAFVWSFNADGLAVRFFDKSIYEKAKSGSANENDQIAFIRMQMLSECGQADVQEVEGGIFIKASDAVRLDAQTREGFTLPPPWPGGMRLRTESVPQLSNFSAHLGLIDHDGNVIWNWTLKGPILEVNGAYYLPTGAQFAAVSAFSVWRVSEKNDEFDNLSLLLTLREAWDDGCHIDLEAYRETIIAKADNLSIDARVDEATEDLILRPMVSGDFPAIDADKIEERLAQLAEGNERSILRVGQTIVLLDPSQTAQARALAVRGRVPKSERKTFERNPPEWLAEHVFPDIDIEFSPRVTGVGAWKGGYLGATWEDHQDWFNFKPEIVKEHTPKTEKEGKRPIEPESREGLGEEIPEKGPIAPLIPLIIPNDEELGFGWRFADFPTENEEALKLDFTRFARFPLAHQEKSIRWLLFHARRALERQNVNVIDKTEGFGAGALLADDMGLGKTFSTLICIAEWYELWRKTTNSEPPAVVIVAPLSLLENWRQEISKTLKPENRVFSRILVAQADADLKVVRRHPGSRDVAVPGDVTEYGLGFGDGTERSIDYPGGCVLTTYQTLRDYRFSFAKAEWGAAIFDEAQNIKNPNALQTIAAKALKALFRIALTGTPVENHLGDFWSIIDATEPGWLGSFADFKKKWIVRMLKERERMAEVGQELRDHVGGLMMRRTKEDELPGLPKKSGSSEPIFFDMSPAQITLYNSVMRATRDTIAEDKIEGSERQNRQLAALWQLRQISLHPDLLSGGNIQYGNDPHSCREVLRRSGKLAWLIECLDLIKEKDEKVLVFCVQKKLQEALSSHLGRIYGLLVPVINGDTKAIARGPRNQENTRLGLIEQFSNRPGFGVCILSPIAAGAGLNIVAANHVIHLERHWNPAKEDQATDRAYRIGQTRPVRVYLPSGIHPDASSFDFVLHRLLEKKRKLQSSLGLIPPEAVEAPELINDIFGQPSDSLKGNEYLDLKEALRLSWRLFEALIATIYAKNADRVILTPGASDHGCDVVVLGWGEGKDNLLIQCKLTSRDELDSEVAVREIEGARPFYEKALGVSFNNRILHTTAKKFGRRTSRAGEVCGVTLHGRSWLSDKLSKEKIERSKVLAADSKRERIR
jgi:hypothetical protein